MPGYEEVKTLGAMLYYVAAWESEHEGHRLNMLSSWHNGTHWMATASIDTRFMQVAHGTDPEDAQVKALKAALDAFDDPAERPSTGKASPKLTEDGY